MLIMLKILGIWLFCVMVHRVNPINDPNNPASRQNYYHPENARAREIMRRERQEDPEQVILNWNSVSPHLYPGVIALICAAADSIITYGG